MAFTLDVAMQCNNEQSAVLLTDGTFFSAPDKKLAPRKMAMNEIVF